MALGWIARLARPALLRTLLADARLALRLLRDPRVPMLVKGVPALAALYFLSPVDLLPDFFPFAGQVDDVIAVVAAIKGFLALCPRSVVAYHREALGRGTPFAPMSPSDEVIDAEYRRDA